MRRSTAGWKKATVQVLGAVGLVSWGLGMDCFGGGCEDGGRLGKGWTLDSGRMRGSRVGMYVHMWHGGGWMETCRASLASFKLT